MVLERRFEKTPRINEQIDEEGESDDSKTDELETRRQEDSDFRELLKQIEASMSAWFKIQPPIGQNRATVIEDKLSEHMKRLVGQGQRNSYCMKTIGGFAMFIAQF